MQAISFRAHPVTPYSVQPARRLVNSNLTITSCTVGFTCYLLSQELRGVRFQMAKCKGMNERLGKKNEERKKDNHSLGLFLMRHMNRDFSVSSTKATRL
eukprot:scaffold17073_cov76-Skeletonema_dohrnii-CCMP3373.AAC.2